MSSTIAFSLIFSDKVSHWTKHLQVSQTGWPMSSRDPSVSTLYGLGIQIHTQLCMYLNLFGLAFYTAVEPQLRQMLVKQWLYQLRAISWALVRSFVDRDIYPVIIFWGLFYRRNPLYYLTNGLFPYCRSLFGSIRNHLTERDCFNLSSPRVRIRMKNTLFTHKIFGTHIFNHKPLLLSSIVYRFLYSQMILLSDIFIFILLSLQYTFMSRLNVFSDSINLYLLTDNLYGKF